MAGDLIKVYIGFGSNLGDRVRNIKGALQTLDGEGDILIRKVSHIYETEPQYVKEQPKFMNCVALAETFLEPDELLKRLKYIEKKLGRRREKRWGPRVIDIDILLYNNLVVEKQGLEIPHPRLQERFFVLKPLSEIAPRLRHPVLDKTTKQLLDELPHRVCVTQSEKAEDMRES